MRLFDTWMQLGERYGRRSDADDIVDIRTGEVIKDRGVLRSLQQRFKLGDITMSQDVPGYDPGNEANSEGAGPDLEEDADDLEDVLDGKLSASGSRARYAAPSSAGPLN